MTSIEFMSRDIERFFGIFALSIRAGAPTNRSRKDFMRFSVEQDDELVVFTIKEPSLDSTNAPDVKSELLILCQPDVKALVIDLAMVHFCDSQGLSSLLLAHRQMKDHEGFVVLVGVQDTVRKLFAISQIEYLFEFQPTVQDAISWLQTD